MRLVMIAFLLFPVAAIADDWPEFLGPRRDGSTLETGLARSWPAKGPPVLWKVDVGSGFAGPIVVGKKVVIHYRVADDERIDVVEIGDARQHLNGNDEGR